MALGLQSVNVNTISDCYVNALSHVWSLIDYTCIFASADILMSPIHSAMRPIRQQKVEEEELQTMIMFYTLSPQNDNLPLISISL